MLPSAAANVAPPTQAHGAASTASPDAKPRAPRRARSLPVPTSPAHAPAAETANAQTPAQASASLP
eukprot:540901-Prymnesium_polylepis.1